MIKIKPGIMVALSVRCNGGVTYQTRDITRETEENTDIAKWETTRIIADREEHERATKVRAAARNLVTRACTHTAFGLLCPESNEEALNEAINAARAIVAEFNATARTTQVSVYALKGRVASTDEEAAAAISAEVRGLLDEMETACRAADAEAIREAATRAKNLGAVLDGPAGYAVSEAIKAARSAARAIVKRIEKEGESAEAVLAEINLAPIEVARFLLTQDAPEVVTEGEALPGVDAGRFTGLGMDEPTTDEGSSPDTAEVQLSPVTTHLLMEV